MFRRNVLLLSLRVKKTIKVYERSLISRRPLAEGQRLISQKIQILRVNISCDNWESYRGAAEDSRLLKCEGFFFAEYFQTSRRTVVSSYASLSSPKIVDVREDKVRCIQSRAALRSFGQRRTAYMKWSHNIIILQYLPLCYNCIHYSIQ